ncbi:1-phosphatidylinositol-4,5-bisphosphate phosphodiesterase delta-3 [Tilletiaria anomala UBC 951]|uniref:Phosphoinositide phospholipase C n=1 Tax=Tilletiaria anomala (strain ATCC 24038 / CBS 436.72 / UBC 951) TaxID=1037660 RepID=A0A066WQJ0_TILAU|nr:1-phosphatidylinositol-4,5-bisphosphate phosphodiesterase delta-3 [Tilletiaria anomala UBC 951]KDN52875.1 1-phosphatidylinositol-4,5-bisphosphate phosphodiesterase delta-3 [Tilletiaria anomala UBC 951]
MPYEIVPVQLTHELAHLNPFRSALDEGGEELGHVVTEASIAGGGRRAEDRKGLHVSHALRSFLADAREIEEGDVGDKADDAPLSPAVQAVLDRPAVQVPAYVNDRSHSLSEYFVSSSHNTYLTADQLVGKSSSTGYTHTLLSGARCVEIDAWDNEKDPSEPKVTHGMTLVSRIPFRAVVKVMRECVDRELAESQLSNGALPPPAPVMLSLENHCSSAGQKRLVEIMHEEWGDRLVSDMLIDGAGGKVDDVKLDQLSGKIIVMVEWYPDEREATAAEELDISSSDDEETIAAKKAKAAAKKEKIIPELAALGCYANSVKPSSDAWLRGTMNEPKNHLINLSESAAGKIIKDQRSEMVSHNAKHLIRVYPKGTRITSRNLYPVPFWNAGAQVCALNWQTFDASMQLNDALFAGTSGWVLKPPQLRRQLAPPEAGRTRLSLEVVGATDLPIPAGHNAEDIKPYVTVSLYHPTEGDGGGNGDGKRIKQKTEHYRQHKLHILHRGEQPPPVHAVWKQKLTWAPFGKSELAFVRLLVKSDDRLRKNPVFAVASMRLAYAPTGYTFLRLLSLAGRETKSTLLVKFTLEDA